MERRQRKSVSDKNIGGDFDYAPSDVYLFVKVLWMAYANIHNAEIPIKIHGILPVDTSFSIDVFPLPIT